MANIDYSRVAGAYRWLEVLVFSSTLQKARLTYLEVFLQSLIQLECPSIAVVGDGDGRFLAELLKCEQDFKIDYIDCSPGMLRVAQKRAGHDSRVTWRCEQFERGSKKSYDAIACHFVLNGFGSEQRKHFVGAISASLNPNGILLVSDFDSRAHRMSAALVFCMQCFFHVFSGVPFADVSRLDEMFIGREMTKLGEMEWWKGAIFSQMWKM
ncbi:MAG: 2-polyprenyl-3-methyl-5-hydroxy-6-metoxy-1,4-benzoquinol methylase [Crocinitomicaceae bacterium]